MSVRQPNPTQAAGILRAFLKEQGLALKHTAALEAVARVSGFTDWQAMAAAQKATPVNADKSALKARLNQKSDDEFELLDTESVWIGVGSLSVYLRPTDEGVVVDLYPRDVEDGESLASTYAFYQEALGEQCERHGIDIDDVAEWVGLHYQRNFEAESPAHQASWVKRYVESQVQAEEVMRKGSLEQESPAPRYVFGPWAHLFGAGQSDTTVRLAYDRHEERLVHLDIKSASGWMRASEAMVQDVEQSLKEANEEALDDPENWGLAQGENLPHWAC